MYSMYSNLQNVNKVFLDSRLGPTLSCLVAEKVEFPDQLLFSHNNKVKSDPRTRLILKSRPPDLSPGLDFTQDRLKSGGLDSRNSLVSRISLTLLL